VSDRSARRTRCAPRRWGPHAAPDGNPPASLEWAQEALDLIPGAQLRTIPGAGFLVAYDDPVVLARELISFCG